jgi:hypothetical protein
MTDGSIGGAPLRGEIWVPPTAARREATRVVKVKMDFMEILGCFLGRKHGGVEEEGQEGRESCRLLNLFDSTKCLKNSFEKMP